MPLLRPRGRRAFLAAAACILLSCLIGPGAHAQAYPGKALRFIAPFPPGGTSDVLCRLIAKNLTDTLGQPVAVENRPGAGANIGHEIAAKSAPDGYTIILTNSSTMTTNPHLYKRMGFDPVADFAPVSMVAKAGQVLVVHPNVPAKSVAELIALAKAKPGKLNFGSGGIGITSHISGEIFKSKTGVNIVHVPYKGTIQAVTDLVAGQVDMVFADMVPAIPQIKAGKLRPLAVTSDTRSAVLPEVPTMAESGLPNFDAAVWWAVLAPRGTPPEVIARLNADLDKVMKLPEVQERYAGLGIATAHSTPQAVTETIRRETPEMAKILKAAGVEPE
jgi:tripartite-type tricarboxylate transporter receptor subunit TctC